VARYAVCDMYVLVVCEYLLAHDRNPVVGRAYGQKVIMHICLVRHDSVIAITMRSCDPVATVHAIPSTLSPVQAHVHD
jgi:hypothetical protein